MMTLRSKLLSAFGYISIITASPVLQRRDFPNPEPCQGNCSWIHDPNIYVQGNTYYRFSTSGNIAIATASSLNGPWTYRGALLQNGTKIVVDPQRQDIWVRDANVPNCSGRRLTNLGLLQAPNVVKIGDTYYCYYSVSVFGSQDSQIGVATSTTLDVGSWTDHGSLNVPKSEEYNLIDPAVFQDGDSPLAPIYITFGSYWNGIFLTPLDKNSLTAFAGSSSGMTNVARNSTGEPDVIEGAIIFKQGGKYFLFFSAGDCCAKPPNLRAPGHEYRIEVCRADDIEGPYTDKTGKNCATENGGTLVLGSHGDVYAPGGQGVMLDPKSNRVVLYYHYGKPIATSAGIRRLRTCKLTGCSEAKRWV